MGPNPKRMIFLVLLLNLALNVVGVPNVIPEYVYEFGKKGGDKIFNSHSWIGWLRFDTEVTIPCPPDTQVSYVKVTVKAINPPKVDYNEETRTVSIKYSYVEFSGSTYRIYAEGIKLYKDT
ncbi:uncharacterized protein LOC125237356 [Leguminivora glycinivorella]|uniref:uncharacterized protein LOC125237356 n=1 Tax=Leguminivora glycinivorella TaxID=1035111 RepID=UPI00200C0F6E|nr:uncharacterized protein LOC125237356 [Leguminivora glycinivorella]